MEATIEYRISQSWTIEQKNQDGVMLFHGSYPGETPLDAIRACIAAYERSLSLVMEDLKVCLPGEERYLSDRINSGKVILNQLREMEARTEANTAKAKARLEAIDHDEDEEEAEFFNQMEALHAEEE